MKSLLKKGYLLGLSLLGIFLIVGYISVVNGLTIKTTSEEFEHRVKLHSLYLDGGVPNEVLMGTTLETGNLNIFNGLSIGGNAEGFFGGIGGGLSNGISQSTIGGGIGGGESNQIYDGNYSAIGGGLSNEARNDDSVVVGGSGGKAFNGGIVLGGLSNEATEGVVLGGSGNKAMSNSLVLGQNVMGNANSFMWSSVGGSDTDVARIDADSGVLIGTDTPIDGVSLVVNGSVKLGSGNVVVGAINFNSSGCITMFDGKKSHVLGKKSSKEDNCGISSGCQFGSVLLQDGDVVTGYTVSYSTGCNQKAIKVSCENGNLSGGSTIYPYCYKISG